MAREARTFRAEGIVLRRRNVGEADSIFVVFGPELGKFEGVARGIRKSRSRMRGHLEPLTFSRFLLARGRTLDVFTQAETIRSFPRIGGDLERWAAASYYAQLVDRFTGEDAPHPELFELLFVALEALNDGSDPGSVSRYVEIHMLALAGFELQVDACAACSARLSPEETLLAPGAGGLVCRQCRPGAGVGRLVSVPAIKVLRYAARASLPQFTGLHIPGEVAEELQQALAGVIRYHLDRELPTARLARELSPGSNDPATPGADTL